MKREIVDGNRINGIRDNRIVIRSLLLIMLITALIAVGSIFSCASPEPTLFMLEIAQDSAGGEDIIDVSVSMNADAFGDMDITSLSIFVPIDETRYEYCNDSITKTAPNTFAYKNDGSASADVKCKYADDNCRIEYSFSSDLPLAADSYELFSFRLKVLPGSEDASILTISPTILFAGNQELDYTESVKCASDSITIANTYFTVNYYNYDGTFIKSERAERGNFAVYTGDTPTRPDEGDVAYIFSDWSDTLECVESDMDVYAEYKEVPAKIEYIFYDRDGVTVISRTIGRYGDIIIPPKENPSGFSDGTSFYSFVRFDGYEAGMTLTEDCSFIAVFDKISGDATLSSLEIFGVKLTPAFAADVVSYTSQVPFDVSSVDIIASANDENARVSVNGGDLAVGTNTISVVVTAQNGSKKIYTVEIVRNTNDKASDSTLSSLSVVGFDKALSPAFSKNRMNYVVWLPYEAESVEIKTSLSDKTNAKIVSITGNKNLTAGADNVITIIVQAGNGTLSTYTITAKRASSELPSDLVAISGTVFVAGKFNPGEKLSASVPALENGATVEYEWFADGEKVGVGQSYNPSFDDVGKSLVVKVTGTGLYRGELQSQPSTVNIAEKEDTTTTPLAGTVSIEGEAKVGKTLKVKTDSISENAEYICCWYSDGELVGEGEFYNVSEKDAGKDITCVLTGKGEWTGRIVSSSLRALSADSSFTPIDNNPGKRTAKPWTIVISVVAGVIIGAAVMYLVLGKQKTKKKKKK